MKAPVRVAVTGAAEARSATACCSDRQRRHAWPRAARHPQLLEIPNEKAQKALKG
jgi:hypothetical protein